MTHLEVITQLNSLIDKDYQKRANQWFKTDKGDYAEHDTFIGVRVPSQRKVAKQFTMLPFKEIEELLNSHIHEYKGCGVYIMVYRYQKMKRDLIAQKEIVNFYLNHLNTLNNWDFVDSSAYYILGDWLLAKPNIEQEKTLLSLCENPSLWYKRVAIISTLAFIKENQFQLALKIIEINLETKEDLLHKAMGWMLREIYKKENSVTLSFLDKFYNKLPRTTLRYAIELLPKEKRLEYLNRNK